MKIKKKINGSKFASVIQMFLPFTLIDLIGFVWFPALTVVECCHEWFKFKKMVEAIDKCNLIIWCITFYIFKLNVVYATWSWSWKSIHDCISLRFLGENQKHHIGY